MSARWTRLVVAGLLAATVACGGDDDDGEETSSSARNTAAAAAEPLRIGFANAEGGSLDFPEVRFGAEAAVRHVNEDGGVSGRAVEYVRCDVDGSPERSIDCANRFVEEGVVAVHTGLDYAVGAMLPILESAGIPLVGGFPYSPDVLESEGAFFLSTSPEAIVAGPLQFFADEGLRTVRFLWPDTPANQAFHDGLVRPAAGRFGLDHETLFYPSSAPDWSALVATAMAADPDVMGGVSGEAACTAFVSAARSAGYEGTLYISGGCTQFVDALGEQAAGVTLLSNYWRADAPDEAPPAKQAEIDLFRTAMADAGHGGVTSTYAVAGFSVAYDLARIVATIDGPIDGAAIATALRDVQAFDSFLGPEIACDGTVVPGQNVCSDAMLFWEVQPDGSLRALTDEFIHVAPAD